MCNGLCFMCWNTLVIPVILEKNIRPARTRYCNTEMYLWKEIDSLCTQMKLNMQQPVLGAEMWEFAEFISARISY